MEPTRGSVALAVASLGAVLALIAVGIVTSMRVGTLALALALMVGALARLVLRTSITITVRHRILDAIVLMVGGVALAYLGVTTALD